MFGAVSLGAYSLNEVAPKSPSSLEDSQHSILLQKSWEEDYLLSHPRSFLDGSSHQNKGRPVLLLLLLVGAQMLCLLHPPHHYWGDISPKLAKAAGRLKMKEKTRLS